MTRSLRRNEWYHVPSSESGRHYLDPDILISLIKLTYFKWTQMRSESSSLRPNKMDAASLAVSSSLTAMASI